MTSHEERVLELRNLYEKLFGRLIDINAKKLPEKVDVKKLEAAYEKLKGYTFVLKKRQV